MYETISRIATAAVVIRYMRGQSIRNRKKHALLACMPKSGSSFFASVVGALDGFRVASIVQDYDRNEQELSELALLRYHNVNYVTQNHVRYSRPVERLIYAFNLRPVVLTRNIFDIVVSMRDHFKRVSLIWPLAYVPEDILSRSDDEIELFIADMMVPWYLNFYFSWTLCHDALWLDYDDMISDLSGALKNVGEHLDLPLTAASVDKAMETVGKLTIKTRNRGVSGRGRFLSHAAKAHIDHLVGHYSEAQADDKRFRAIFLSEP
jgi:hypothetical protein